MRNMEAYRPAVLVKVMQRMFPRQEMESGTAMWNALSSVRPDWMELPREAKKASAYGGAVRRRVMTLL